MSRRKLSPPPSPTWTARVRLGRESTTEVAVDEEEEAVADEGEEVGEGEEAAADQGEEVAEDQDDPSFDRK